METTNLTTEDRDDVMPEWYESFPEPHTIPSGWDLRGVLEVPVPNTSDSTNAVTKG